MKQLPCPPSTLQCIEVVGEEAGVSSRISFVQVDQDSEERAKVGQVVGVAFLMLGEDASQIVVIELDPVIDTFEESVPCAHLLHQPSTLGAGCPRGVPRFEERDHRHPLPFQLPGPEQLFGFHLHRSTVENALKEYIENIY